MKITDILTLSDGNKYMLTNKVDYNDKVYLCLVDINNSENIKIGYLDGNKITIVKKENINETLALKLFNGIGKMMMNLE